MKHEEWEPIAARIKGSWPRMVDEDFLLFLEEGLVDFDVDQVQASVNSARREMEYPPKLKDILEYIRIAKRVANAKADYPADGVQCDDCRGRGLIMTVGPPLTHGKALKGFSSSYEYGWRCTCQHGDLKGGGIPRLSQWRIDDLLSDNCGHKFCQERLNEKYGNASYTAAFMQDPPLVGDDTDILPF